MTTKKIIAICQSGGDFEMGKDESLSYKGGEAYAVDLDQQTQLTAFKQELAEMFQYSVDGILIKYFIPGNRKTLITISRDKDLQHMVNFYEDCGQVEVFIITEEGAARNMSNMPHTQAYVFPSLSKESYTRGASVVDSKAKLKQIYEFLVNPDHIIISSTGRPWIIIEKRPRCGTFRTLGSLMPKSQHEVSRPNLDFLEENDDKVDLT